MVSKGRNSRGRIHKREISVRPILYVSAWNVQNGLPLSRSLNQFVSAEADSLAQFMTRAARNAP